VRAAGTLLTAAVLACAPPACAQTGDRAPAHRVLIVVNDNSAISLKIGEYYAQRRGIPAENVCHLRTMASEAISRDTFDHEIAAPIGAFLMKGGLVESVYYIVTTAGVPLKIPGTKRMDGDYASVDSELTLLYQDLKTGVPHTLAGPAGNPFFGKRDRPFSHPEFPMYLVTRLAAYDFEGVKGMIDRSLAAANRGKFVIDLSGPNDAPGDNWLRDAAILLPKDRVILDETSNPVYGKKDVIGYASWGSNDGNHDRRFPGFQWLPGAIMTEYVSTDGRTFEQPPKWTAGNNWANPLTHFAGSPQSLSADYILEGATGASGHVDEPFLTMTPRPDLLLPAYYHGRNLAESYYLAIPALSWQNIVLGDPLCSLGKP
jgi:uncharacterized protein (TIGR03790 family)